MSIGRKLFSLFTVALIVLALPAAALAREVPQDIPGSIQVSVRYGGKGVPGGTVTCVQVGEVVEDDGNYSFRRLDGQALADIQSPELAAELEKYARDKKLTGTTLTVGDEGKVTFPNLKIGLYLLTQETPAPGYTKFKPFLVSVPYFAEGKYQYEVTAKIKSELERVPETEPTETEPTATVPRETEPKLPQTGQLNWPVPVLAALGLLLFSAGWALRCGKKKDGYEQ